MKGDLTIIDIGKFHTLKIANFTTFGAYLDAQTGSRRDNILLPLNQLPEGLKEGDPLEVFIYRDSEDRLIATRKRPFAQAGELAYLEVTAKTKLGAFLDFGLERGLFLPFREQKYPLEIGHKYLIGVYVDKSGRLACTTDIYKYLQADSPYQKNDKVTGTVYLVKDGMGAMVAVDDKFFGLIPENEYFRALTPGQRTECRVIRVREDGKLDLSPREVAHRQREDDSEKILAKLQENGGILTLTDDSSPEEIKAQLDMSKSAFKRAVGKLLKEQKIISNERGLLRK